ncbi:MAG: PD-(D/E)XK nuclease family protein, partial [Synergistaceae bacterium]|nr:PD-(D/E)XK nuclease family protein [Synergistaceae bacterium]
RAARLISPSEALSELVRDDSWLASYDANTRPRILSNVRRGIELLREYESSIGRNLASCVDYLAREMRSASDAEEPSLADDERDEVRAMTVHASKGLEFPVVALMNMESSLKRRRGMSKASASRWLGVVSSRLIDGSESVRWKWHRAIERLDEMEESARLLYVAMTRAKDRVICCGIPGVSPGGDWLSTLLAANAENGCPIPIKRADDIEPPKTRPAPPPRPEPPKSEPRAARKYETSLARLTASAYSLISWCPAAYRMRYRQGRNLKWERSSQDRYGGADLGTLTHWALERWDFTRQGAASILPDEMDEGGRADIPNYLRHIAGRANRAAIRGWLEGFARTDECAAPREALARGLVTRELSFSVTRSGVNLVGNIDIFWEDSSGCHVRDWKITPEEDAPHELYAAQIEFYAMACRTARPGVPVDAGLVYLRSPGTRAAEPISDWEGIENRIRAAARVSSEFMASRRGDCPRCPFRKDCRAYPSYAKNSVTR